jgi:acyl-CoA thioesterase-1
MNRRIKALPLSLSGFMALLVTFICTACMPGGTTGNTPTSFSPTPKLPSIVRQHPLTGPITYVALGASDAVGVGSNQPGSQGYVPLIATHLPKGSHLVNLGISGIRVREALTEELPIALATSPNLITIWLVANDFVGGVSYTDYIHDLNTLLAQLRASTRASLFMADLPDLTRLPAFSSLNSAQKARMLQQIQHWNAGIATLARQYNVTLVDLYSHDSQLTAHPEYISGDGFHPSPSGYVQLANIFWQAING